MARRKFSSFEEDILKQTGVTLPDGRVFRPGGGILSAGDAANTAATTARNAALYAQTAGASEPARLAAREQARANYFMPAAAAAVAPALAPAATAPAAAAGMATFDPAEDFKSTQLLRDAQTRKLLPDRNYSEQALAKATPMQRIAEANLLKQRIGDRALSIATLGETPAVGPVSPNSMTDQAAEFLPGTQIKAPAGSSIAAGADGNLILTGPDGVVNRINPSDTGALAAWAASQTAAPVAALSSFADQAAAANADIAKAVSMGLDSRTADAVLAKRLDQFDPTGEQRDAIKFAREEKEAAARFAAERTQRGLLAGDAEARANATFEQMLPDIQRELAATENKEATLEQVANTQLQRTLAQKGDPLIKSATIAANQMSGKQQPEATRAAAQQLLSAIESNNPAQVALVIAALPGELQLEALRGPAAAFTEEATALSALVARQVQQEGSQLRSQQARLLEAARYRRPAGGTTMASVADGGAAAPNSGAVAGDAFSDILAKGAGALPAAKTAASTAGIFTPEPAINSGLASLAAPVAQATLPTPASDREAYVLSGYRGTFEQWKEAQKRRQNILEGQQNRQGLKKRIIDFFERADAALKE